MSSPGSNFAHRRAASYDQQAAGTHAKRQTSVGGTEDVEGATSGGVTFHIGNSEDGSPGEESRLLPGTGTIHGENSPLSPRYRHFSYAAGLSGSSSWGASLKDMTAASPQEFVSKFGGKRVIERILIANNGIAAVKCMRSIRRWSLEMFRNERSIKFEVMATPEDLEANAEYIKLADNYIQVPGGSNNNNYANVDLIVELAIRHNVQGVWAGWGHASENPKLPQMLSRAGIAFLGPTASSMHALGDKIASSIVAQTVGVPTMPWSGSHLKLDLSPDDLEEPMSVPESLFNQAMISNAEEGLVAATKVGFPVMIKASEGGGGKGIRKSLSPDDFISKFRAVQAEVPGSPIFVMRMATDTRHIEVQILADEYGNAISLFSRDCSVQRRHQKIIEEAPSVVTGREVSRAMEKAAVSLAKAVGYVNAGTVEYLYTREGFYFLELNPRLQVEHPCTEMVADVNLPACQLQVAMGIPLHRMKDIRLLYHELPWCDNAISFDTPKAEPKPKGHVIACRITSENPDEGFKPNSGALAELNFKSSKNVWGYFSVSGTGEVHQFADSQFGHCFAYGDNRYDAISNMVMALKELSIRSDFCTTVDYLINLLQTDEFCENLFDTNWLDERIASNVVASPISTSLKIPAVIAAAVHIADAEVRSSEAQFRSSLQRGQVPHISSLDHSKRVQLIYLGVKYHVDVTLVSPTEYHLSMNSFTTRVQFHRLNAEGLLLSLENNTSHTAYIMETVDGYKLQLDNSTVLFDKENDPSLVRAPSAGKLVEYLVDEGEHVTAGTEVATIEVMKMCMSLKVPVAGAISFVKRPGAIISPGMLLATVELEDPSAGPVATRFAGGFGLVNETRVESANVNEVFRQTVRSLEYILDGYCLPSPAFEENLTRLIARLTKTLQDPTLPLLEIREILNAMSGRLHYSLETSIREELQKYASNITALTAVFPAKQIIRMLDDFAANLSSRADRDLFVQNTQPITQICTRYREGGLRGNRVQTLGDLFRRYLAVEEQFQVYHAEKCVRIMHEANVSIDTILGNVRAHSQMPNRNQVIVALLNMTSQMSQPVTTKLRATIERFTNLHQAGTNRVALTARKVLISLYQEPYETRRNRLEQIFHRCVSSESAEGSPEIITDLIDQETAIIDVLIGFFFHEKRQISSVALEVYIRRAYIAYEITSLNHELLQNEIPLSVFHFSLPDFHPNRVRLPRNPSVIDMYFPEMHSTEEPTAERVGAMAAFSSLDQLKQFLPSLVTKFPFSDSSRSSFDFRDHGFTLPPMRSEIEKIHILNLMVNDTECTPDQDLAEIFKTLCKQHANAFLKNNVRRVTFMAYEMSKSARGKRLTREKFFTYRTSSALAYEKAFKLHKSGSDPKMAEISFEEDTLYRHLEPGLAFQLEINRMRNYDLQLLSTSNLRLHMYLGTGKNSTAKDKDSRFFLRTIVRHASIATSTSAEEYLRNEAEKLLLESLDELELAFANPNYPRTDGNHIFFNFVPTVIINPITVEGYVRDMIMKFGMRLWKHRVLAAEMKFMIQPSLGAEKIPIRITVLNASGFVINIHTYRERLDKQNGLINFEAWNKSDPGPLDGMPISTPYVTKDHLQSKRFLAQRTGIETTYVYDFPPLIQQIISEVWDEYLTKYPTGSLSPKPNKLLKYQEMILSSDRSEITLMNRNPGENKIGMVAWLMTLFTPECPYGRDIVLIANDITHLQGSFGVAEDILFQKASELARNKKIPRVYVSANSGARIGLANEVRELFKAAWKDPARPDKGFEYLYISSNDYPKISKTDSVQTELIQDGGESRYKITAIIGKDPDLGVENLAGSGLIAGETSRAYRDIVTYSIVTCRAIGIGAYLVRLGQRVIQVENSNIILTGYAALNKLLGKEVYADNAQLGGTQIMHYNGVSHATTDDDRTAVRKLIDWLSFCSVSETQGPPKLPELDPVARSIDFQPSKQAYDPRHMLAGKVDETSGAWVSGFFDRGSWDEVMAVWAPSVVVGRARLGGMPIAVVAVETRTVDVVTPADPANPDSERRVVPQAGQVWYPDSAYKTAQAIRDFNKEGLPIIIFANWRGFSGGMKDMFDQVLKFGAYIVDALRDCEQPVIIYIPPFAEVRGGAWVVIDRCINPDRMEMYADPDSRGGVLEPEGTVEIKYKLPLIRATMERLDDKYRAIAQQLKDSILSPEKKASLQQELEHREELLTPIYHSIAVQFADLHDMPARMMSKEVVNEIVPWQGSRQFFYWRILRLNLEDQFYRSLKGSITRRQYRSMLQRWFVEAKGAMFSSNFEKDNKLVAEWLQQELAAAAAAAGAGVATGVVASNVKHVYHEHIVNQVKEKMEAESNPELTRELIEALWDLLPESERAHVVDTLDAAGVTGRSESAGSSGTTGGKGSSSAGYRHSSSSLDATDSASVSGTSTQFGTAVNPTDHSTSSSGSEKS